MGMGITDISGFGREICILRDLGVGLNGTL
jgi:hypothetical protein